MFDELVVTNGIFATDYPYTPLQDPAENLAERLILLTHIPRNRDVWNVSTERRNRYWAAYKENCEGSANTNRVSIWWVLINEGMAITPLIDETYLHEVNLLLNPTALSIPVEDQDILQVFRQQTPYLANRVSIWSRARGKALQESKKKEEEKKS